MKKLSDTLREIDAQLGIETYGAISAAADALDEKNRLIKELEQKIAEYADNKSEIECECCNGAGKTGAHHNTGFDSSGHFWTESECPACKGSGKIDLCVALERKNKLLQSHCKFIADLGKKTTCETTRKTVDFWKQINASWIAKYLDGSDGS